jgi:AsmA protein
VTLALSEDVKAVDIGAAVKAYAKSDRLSGRANVVAKLAGSGATDAALIGSLAGPIDFEVKNGALEGLDVAYELERAQALFEKQVPPARTGPERTTFDVLSGHSRLEHGVLSSDPLRLETQVLKVAGKGTFRLADQAVAYQLVAHVQQAPPAGSAGGLAKLRSAEIPIEVTGTVHDYKVRPDLSGIVKGRLKEELDKHKDELRDKLKDKLKDLFSH